MSKAQDTIGKIHSAEQERDAVHIALCSAVAGETLQPGQHVGFYAEHMARNVVTDKLDGKFPATGLLGIVDPFLTQPVLTGQHFWLFLYPNTITDLRHEWTHPALETPGRVYLPAGCSPSEKWIREYASGLGITYHDLMDGAHEHVEYGGYLSRGGTLEGVSTSAEFWEHYEVVTGDTVPDDKKDNFFSCSC